MTAIKETLHHAIEALNDAEAEQVLAFAQRLKDRSSLPKILQRLANDPAFALPAENTTGYQPVQPIQGKGIPASELLLKDRR